MGPGRGAFGNAVEGRAGVKDAWRTAWLALAAAACLVLAVALIVVLRQSRRRKRRDAGRRRGTTAAAGSPVPIAEHPELKTVAEELELAEQHYEKAIRGLEKLANDRQVLDPQVAAMLQKNLQLIDLAIGESRAALKRSRPASRRSRACSKRSARRSRCCRTPSRSSTRCARATRPKRRESPRG